MLLALQNNALNPPMAFVGKSALATGTTTVLPVYASAAAGNLLVACVTANQATAAPFTLTGATTGWTQRVTVGSTNCTAEIWEKIAVGSDTMPTWNGGTNTMRCIVAEFSGTTSFDQTGTTAGATSRTTDTVQATGVDGGTGRLVIAVAIERVATVASTCTFTDNVNSAGVGVGINVLGDDGASSIAGHHHSIYATPTTGTTADKDVMTWSVASTHDAMCIASYSATRTATSTAAGIGAATINPTQDASVTGEGDGIGAATSAPTESFAVTSTATGVGAATSAPTQAAAVTSTAPAGGSGTAAPTEGVSVTGTGAGIGGGSALPLASNAVTSTAAGVGTGSSVLTSATSVTGEGNGVGAGTGSHSLTSGTTLYVTGEGDGFGSGTAILTAVLAVSGQGDGVGNGTGAPSVSGAVVPPATHAGGGARWPLYSTYRQPVAASTPKAKRQPVTPLPSRKDLAVTSLAAAHSGGTARPILTLAPTGLGAATSSGTASARLKLRPTTIAAGITAGVATPMLTLALSSTSAGTTGGAANGTVEQEVASVAAAQGMGEGRPTLTIVPPPSDRWTLEERNRHAILYSIDPVLAARAYRKAS